MLEQADVLVSDLVNRNPTNVAVLSVLGEVKLARKDWIGAHEVADAIRRLDDKSSLASLLTGAAFNGEKKFDDSLAVLQGAYTNNPTASRPMEALVDVYLQSKQIDKAESLIGEALKADPGNADALVLLGSIALAKNDPAQATKHFERAIKQQPKSAAGYRALADLYGRQEKSDDAIKVIREGLDQQPKNFTLRLTLADLLVARRDYDGAIAENEALLKDDPGSMIVANNLATLLADHRSDQASLDRADSLTVLLRRSQIPQFKDTFGWVAYRRGDYAVAVSSLEGAVADLPNVAAICFHLGMSYLAIGQDTKALEQFAKARSWRPTTTS